MDTRLILNDFATRSFRDVADHDYIAARMCYRAGLISQFHWSSLQSIEKYLKGILLFNRIKAVGVHHSLSRALEHAKKLPFTLKLSASTMQLIQHIDTFGRFRYLETSFYIEGPKLVQLDKAVWELRRYCRSLNYEMQLADGSRRNMLELELGRINAGEQNPKLLSIPGGALEKIIAAKRNPARQFLLWQNAFFGHRRRKKVRMQLHWHATNAPLTLHPEILDEIVRYVFLPKEVVTAFREEVRKRSES
jgi:hypothetical protein